MSSSVSQSPKKITAEMLRKRKAANGSPKIVATTAYDYTFARLVDDLVDIILVGDSLGMVIQGNPDTLTVKIEDMVYHSRAVAQGAQQAHVVADMPFMSFQPSVEEALKNAGKLIAEGRADSVKLEGGVTILPMVEKLVAFGIPVLGHVGLTPQSVRGFGGYKIQGRTDSAKEAILQDALALDDAGVFGIVLEGIPSGLAKEITERVSCPTIGIGAGPDCDGQVLVSQDLLGMNPEFKPRFVKAFVDMSGLVREAVSNYGKEVKEGKFPSSEHSFQ